MLVGKVGPEIVSGDFPGESRVAGDPSRELRCFRFLLVGQNFVLHSCAALETAIRVGNVIFA